MAAPGTRQQHALSQRHPQQPRASGPHRRAYRQLALARCATHQHQVGQVRAHDQQHEPHTGHQHHAHAIGIAIDVGAAHRHGLHTEPAIHQWIRLRQPFGDAAQLGLCLGQRRTRLQQADRVDVAIAARRFIPPQRHIELIDERELEPRRQDANHGAGTIVDDDRLADDRGIRTVTTLPQAVRDHDHRFEAGRGAFFRQEVAAHDRIDTKELEQFGRHRSTLHALRARHVAAQHEIAEQIRADAFNRSRAAKVDQVGQRDFRFAPARLLLRLRRMGRMQRDETIGELSERHRPQADAVHDAEDRNVGADADRQRQQRGNEESGLLPQAAPGVEEVAKQSAHDGRSIKPYATKTGDSGRDFSRGTDHERSDAKPGVRVRTTRLYC